MKILETVRCPNCGQYAKKQVMGVSQVRSISCYHCDYLLISCLNTGRVLESYAPGLRYS